jgi:hypothetical protein
VSPEQFKAYVISAFSPFFRNKALLDELAEPLLVADAVVMSRLSTDSWSRSMITKALEEHRAAALSDEAACFTGYATWEPAVQKGLSAYWSAFNLEVERKDDLPLEEFAHEVARNMAVVIEASLKPMLKELLFMVRLRLAKPNPSDGLLSLDLGGVVGELINTSDCPELFAPPPWRLPLNHWRNICQHFDLEVRENNIVGHYGKPPHQSAITLSRSSFLDAAVKCYHVFEIVKLARTIAVFDNIPKIRPYFPSIGQRPEQEILSLASAFATQGFELKGIRLKDRSVLVVVQDLTNQPPEKRMLHASQFVYLVWTHFQKESILVEFRDRDGKRWLTTTGREKDCEAVAQGRMPFYELANRVSFLRHT